MPLEPIAPDRRRPPGPEQPARSRDEAKLRLGEDAPEVDCTHCGLPVPAALRRFDTNEQFCCAGCRVVYGALKDNGLLSYYTKRAAFDDEETERAPALATGADYLHYDEEQFRQLYTDRRGELCEVEFYLEGLHCPACIWLVEKLPSLVDGVVEARSSFAEGRLRVLWDPRRATLSRIAQTLDSLGYPPHPAGQGRSRELQKRLDRALLVRIGVAAAAFGNVMLLSFALYSGHGTFLASTTSSGGSMSAQTTHFFRWLSLAIAVPSVLWTGTTFFRGAWAALKTRTPHMDLPVSIGILAALGWGSYATFTDRGEIYFDTVTMLVFLLLVGRWLSARQQRAASEATDLMFALAPSTSRLVEGSTTRQVPTESVPEHAVVEILSGDRVGVDGVVIEGCSKLDESLLSGESAAVDVGPGSKVHAGTVNLSSRLLVRATRTGRDTRLSQLVAEVEAAAARKAPIVMFADRMSGYFVAAVLTLAVVTVALWGLSEGLPHAIALLIVTCPCALGLATPLAASVALSRAAKRGILVKGMQYIEALAQPALIVFDKTGTLTQGKLSLVHFEGSQRAGALLKSLEQRSAHPIAQALCRDLPLAPALSVEAFEEVRGDEAGGSGVRGRVDGHEVRAGNAAFVAHSDDESAMAAAAARVLAEGLSPVYVAVDGKLAAVAALGDALRPEAASCLTQLRARGHRLVLLSGDRQEVVDHVVAQLDVPFEVALGGQSPEHKLRYVEEARRDGTVYMVGDGVNDAAALAAASVGIAVHGGAEASLAAADVFATKGGLQPLTLLVDGAQRTLVVIRRNLLFSLVYNLTAAGLAVAGLITPLAAAVLMPLSSLTVLSNSLRQKTFESPARTEES